METKVLQVFYGKDCLPYKDKERSVHFPIVGAAIQGASNTTKIRFYFDELVSEDDETTTWVVVSKLPNGKIGSEIVETALDGELNEHYALFNLKNFYTQAKGDLFLSLQGYQGGVQVETDPDTGISQILGTPTIQATGSIKLAINYATQLVGSGETSNINFQKILADLGTKLGIRARTELVNQLPTIGETNVFYAIYDDNNNPNHLNIYVWNETIKSYVWVGDNTLNLGDYYTQEQGDAFEQNVNEKLDQQDEQIASLGQLQPTGVDTSANILAFTEDKGIWVGSDTGYWYYWDGTQYVSSGQQFVNAPFDEELNDESTNAVQNKAIASLFTVDYGTNLLDLDNVTQGKYVNPENGTLGSNQAYETTDYIPVSEGQVISLQNGYAFYNITFIAGYDENKDFVSGSGGSSVSNYTVPANVKYIRMSRYGSYSEDMMVIVGTTTKFYAEYHKPYYILKENSFSPSLKKAIETSNCFEKVLGSSNLFDKTKITANAYMSNEGSTGSSSSYFYTDYIPIEEGQTLSFNAGARFICAFGIDGALKADYGVSEDVGYSYTNPTGSGVRYIVITFYSSADIDALMINYGTSVLSYEPYIEPYYILKDNALEIDKQKVVQQQNYFNKNDTDVVLRKYLWQGSLSDNSSYFVTGFMEIEPNTTYSLSDGEAGNARFVEAYDSSKTYISGSALSEAKKITTPSNAKYIRATFYMNSLNNACVVKGEHQLNGLKYEKLIDGSLVSCNRKLLAFLPKEFYCVVGQTLEIYNDQIMPSAGKYHFRWICNIGKPLNRKFTVTGAAGNVGTYSLKLEVYDDTCASLFIMTSTLKVVDTLSTQKSICPIGDSLTNNKYWLKYVNVDLSNGNIQYVGTRGGTVGQKNEGRSGWTATDYLSDTDYSYEQPTTPNPFWSDALERFSWDYYKTTYNIDPDAIQIWLGTNDLLSGNPESFANNIKQMITYIRQDDATIPIFVCLTILPAEQNGIGAQTSNDGFSSNKGMWQYGWWSTIIEGVKLLEKELLELSDSNLHIIPLVCSHDSKYNFGLVETPVNPFTPSITEPMPVEGVHPQQNGYEQIGSILYSCYCAKLGS